MSGTRTKTGCWTCRLRRKKCDEGRPTCATCRARALPCHGYGLPRPAWMADARSWRDVWASSAARDLRHSADRSYRARRARRALELEKEREREREQEKGVVACRPEKSQVSRSVDDGSWWPAVRAASSSSGSGSSLLERDDRRLLHVFLNVIFPLQFGYSTQDPSRPEDRQWLLRALLQSPSHLQASLSVSASFEHHVRVASLRADPDAESRRRQTRAVRGLHRLVRELMGDFENMEAAAAAAQDKQIWAAGGEQRPDDKQLLLLLRADTQLLGRRAVSVLSTMTQLLGFEAFNFLGGQWVMHLRAWHAIAQLLRSQLTCSALASLPAGDRTALTFFVSSLVWIDIIARASHGGDLADPAAADDTDGFYLPLLEDGTLPPVNVAGSVLACIARVTRLETWKRRRIAEGRLYAGELLARADALRERLTRVIWELDGWAGSGVDGKSTPENSSTPETNIKPTSDIDTNSPPPNVETSSPRVISISIATSPTISPSSSPSTHPDLTTISLLFAHAATIYLHTTVTGPNPASPPIHAAMLRCLAALERLPASLLKRVSFAYAVAGCMAGRADEQARFRALVRRAQTCPRAALGALWKAVAVVEECWRLRASRRGELWGWRETMASRGWRILLV